MWLSLWFSLSRIGRSHEPPHRLSGGSLWPHIVLHRTDIGQLLYPFPKVVASTVCSAHAAIMALGGSGQHSANRTSARSQHRTIRRGESENQGQPLLSPLATHRFHKQSHLYSLLPPGVAHRGPHRPPVRRHCKRHCILPFMLFFVVEWARTVLVCCRLMISWCNAIAHSKKVLCSSHIILVLHFLLVNNH